MDFGRTIVIDNGSGMCKAGFAGDSNPSHLIPSIMGIPIGFHVGIMNPRYVGDTVQTSLETITLNYPIDRGTITNYEGLEKIWWHLFYEKMNISPEDHTILLTEPPQSNREHMIQLIFECFNVQAAYLAPKPLLALYSSGHTSGLVVSIGDGVSHTVPIFDAHPQSQGIRRLDIAGRELTDFMVKSMTEKGYSLPCTRTTKAVDSGILRVDKGVFTVPWSTYSNRLIGKSIKEELCYVAQDFETEMKNAESIEKSYELHDGQVILVGIERFKCPEALFHPSLFGYESVGIQECSFNSIVSCDEGIRKELFGNIVLCGGTTMLPGFEERFKTELGRLVGSKEVNMDVNIVSPPNRMNSTWNGGSVVASLPNFTQKCIIKEEYDENGFQIVHKLV